MPDVEIIAETRTEQGAVVRLIRDGARWSVRIDGQVLMSSETSGSEEMLAELTCAGLRERAGVRVLVGGLGMGFTLRAVLDLLPGDAMVDLAELFPEIVEWNRGPLAPLAARPLDDPRVALHVGDVVSLLGRDVRYDAILLDVDNGPEAFTVPDNAGLYDAAGLHALRAALHPGGVLGVWSTFRDRRFERRLCDAGFTARSVPVRARGRVRKGASHVVFLGERPESS